MSKRGRPTRYARINGHNYVLASYMADRIKIAMEAARYDGMVEGARVRASFAKVKAEAIEALEAAE